MKKKLLLTFAAVYAVTYAALVAADPDFVKGYDFTGSSSFTGTKLNQLVDNGYVGANRGMVIYTNSTPDTTGQPKLKRYIWLDTSANPPDLKVYNTNAAVWTNIYANAVYADGSIGAGKLAASAVNSTNIASDAVTASKILDATITGAKIASGTITSANIADGTITYADIAGGGILTSNLADAAITAPKLAANSVGTSNLQSGFALQGTNIASATIQAVNIASNAVALTNLSMSGASASYSVRVNTSGNALEWARPVFTNSTTVVSSSTLPNAATGVQILDHTLGVRPSYVRVVIVCTDSGGDAGWAENDEIEVATVTVTTGEQPYTVASDASNVYIGYDNAGVANGTIKVAHKSTGTRTTVTQSKWKFKAYVAH